MTLAYAHQSCEQGEKSDLLSMNQESVWTIHSKNI